MSNPLTRQELDKMAEPMGGDMLLSANCHPWVPLALRYHDGLLILRCGCGSESVSFTVGDDKPEPALRVLGVRAAYDELKASFKDALVSEEQEERIRSAAKRLDLAISVLEE